MPNLLTYAMGAAIAVLLSLLGVQHMRLSQAKADIAALKEIAATGRETAQRVLNAETTKVLQLERALQHTHNEQESINAASSKTIADLSEKLLARTRAGGGPGLRDPHATACRDDRPAASADPPSAASGPADATEAPGLVSKPLESLLLELTGEADKINIAYAACRADAVGLRARLNP